MIVDVKKKTATEIFEGAKLYVKDNRWLVAFQLAATGLALIPTVVAGPMLGLESEVGDDIIVNEGGPC